MTSTKAVVQTRREARRIMGIVRRHDAKRHRNYGDAPHPHQWGCTAACFTPIQETTAEAVHLAVEVGGIVIIGAPPEQTYAPGWMKPA